MIKFPVYVGFDPDEIEAVNVAEAGLRARSGSRIDVRRISRLSLPNVYSRPTELRDGRLWDVISDAPMSTEHAIARFFIPWLRKYQGWALFMDGDVLVRDDVCELFERAATPEMQAYAVMVVDHPHAVYADDVKKTGDQQTIYPRKNQSSVMLINCAHPLNYQLSLEYLNTVPGRDLHAFNWLQDDEIGYLPARWNYLVNVEPPVVDPAIVHFTLGTPNLAGHENDPYADEWRFWARVAGYKFDGAAVATSVTSTVERVG